MELFLRFNYNLCMNINPNAKRILCYGDSYTWGYIPATGHERFPADKRWTGVLQDKLGKDYEIIEEGLNSRTLASDDKRPGKEGRNGLDYLIPCLDTHDPIDLVILLLGTNELKDTFNTSAEEIGNIVENDYIKVILNRESQYKSTTPDLLLISPPLLNLEAEYARARYSESTEKNLRLATIYQEIADRNKCKHLNSADIVNVGEDGVHFDASNHAKLGKAIVLNVSFNSLVPSNKITKSMGS
ncbi:MAG TPA: hypothetical protein ENI23_04345 [bacterium]|nr:hypothetical protein [bacterium]